MDNQQLAERNVALFLHLATDLPLADFCEYRARHEEEPGHHNCVTSEYGELHDVILICHHGKVLEHNQEYADDADGV